MGRLSGIMLSLSGGLAVRSGARPENPQVLDGLTASPGTNSRPYGHHLGARTWGAGRPELEQPPVPSH